jgi:hypothetical protein
MPEQAFFHDTYRLREQQFRKLRDCFEGEDAVKEQGEVYLPRPSGMADDAAGNAMWVAYKARAIYFSVLERTLRALLGIVFRVPPHLELPGAAEELADKLTSEGDSLGESLRRSVLETLHIGRHGLLLDLPQADGGRPYFAHYYAEDITDWREEIQDGAKVLSMVMLRDAAQTSDDKDTERFRELCLVGGVYVQRCWMVTKTKGTDGAVTTEADIVETITPSIRGNSLTAIPFFFIGPYSNKPAIEKSPVLDIANLSLHHYDISAQWRQALFMCAGPTPVLATALEGTNVPSKIGPGAFWVIGQGDRADFLEFSGSGISSIKEGLDGLAEMMAGMGVKLIQRMRQPETAEAVRVKARDEISVVESTVMSVEDAYKGLLKTAAEWLGVDVKTVNFGMDRDFIEERLDAAMLAALIKACFADKAISRPVYHSNLQRGGVIPTSRTIEDEVADGASGEATPKPVPPAFGGSPVPPADDDTDVDKDEGDIEVDEAGGGQE